MYKRTKGWFVFSYDRGELFESCSLKSAYLSRGVKDKDGGYAGDDLVLTEDERDAFDECLRACVADIFSVLSKMCPLDAKAIDAEDEVVFRAREGGCSDRDAKIVDGKFLDTLAHGVLRGWFALCGEAKLSESCAGAFQEGCKSLWSGMFRMRG